MKVAATLVHHGVHRRAQRVVLVSFDRSTAHVGVAMPAADGLPTFVLPTIPHLNAQHSTGSERHQPLQCEQGHRDQFGEGGGHLVGIDIGSKQYTGSTASRFDPNGIRLALP